MQASSGHSRNLGSNTINSTLVENPSARVSSNIVSNLQTSSLSVNLFATIPSSIFPSNNIDTSTAVQRHSTSSHLKVEDALSYLDRVKNQFTFQPQVYNHFLDIMKEFKSQSIDTQEVINRVSTLFHGHSDLIVGFNTFLPPGYKIEVSNDQLGYIQVTHPSLRTESIPIGGKHGSTFDVPATTLKSSVHQTSDILSQDNDEKQIRKEMRQKFISTTSQAVNALITAANSPQLLCSGTASGLNSSVQIGKQQILNVNNNNNTTNSSGESVEFNHAVNYINTIKTRFNQNPDVYKTFLEILHTYQQQQKDTQELPTTLSTTLNDRKNNQGIYLSEAEVYAKVAKLFTNHEDLLADFSQFLVDTDQKPTECIKSTASILSSSDTLTPSLPSTAIINPVRSDTTPRLIMTSFASSSIITSSISSPLTTTPSSDLLSSTINKDGMCLQPLSKQITITLANTNKRSTLTTQTSAITKKKRVMTTNNIPTVSSNINSRNIQDTTGQNKNLPTIDELSFFDKVQKTLRSPLVFDNFLRCILLYTKQIISRIELFELIQSYLSHVPELLKTFQELIDLREPGEVIIPKSIYDQDDTDSMIRIDYGSCSQYGTSYRAVPRSYVPPICTGRTQLCKEVLNDHCVLFPTFTDESSSVAAKKSVFEEHMYKIEDERFELDIVMEVNLSAIRALENVQLHMNSLTSEQWNNFQLDDHLGGHSAYTQKQAVHRIYGERANEIIDGLKRNPRVAVPIVLKRLKCKDEEWRETKKNFERFWKEQSEKYYLKSLDYMGMNCKNLDGRVIQNRYLLHEIENIKEERDQQLSANNNQPHLVFRYEDLSILDDAASLIIFLVNRQITFSKEEKQNIKKIIYEFLPDFLFAPRAELSDDEEDNDHYESENNTKRDKKSRSTYHIDTNHRRNTDSSTAKPRQIAQEYQKPDDMFHLFFANDNYYYFFRLHQLLCERLLKIFQQSLHLIEQENSSQHNSRLSSSASALRLLNRQGITVDEYYSALLDMVRSLLDGSMDSLSYEDSLREMFGIHAYVAFTLDKIIHSCVRQLHTIVTDELSDASMCLYSRTNSKVGIVDNLDSIAQQSAEVIYQREMETYGDGNRLFRVCSFKNDRRITISLILVNSLNNEDEGRISANGTHYMESYLHDKGNYSETVSAYLRSRLLKRPRFLSRNFPKRTNQSTTKITTINNDYCRIDMKTLERKPFHRAGFFFYKHGSLRSTKQKHKRLTLEKYHRFKRFYQEWSLKHAPNNHNNDFINNFWLKTHRCNNSNNNNNNDNDQQHFTIQSTVSNNDNDLLQPPYRHYQQYYIVDREE